MLLSGDQWIFVDDQLCKAAKNKTTGHETHTCRLLDALQQVFGRNKEVEKALQRIAVVTFLDGAKQLAEDDGRRGLKGWEEGREGALDGRVQRFRVLQQGGDITGVTCVPLVAAKTSETQTTMFRNSLYFSLKLCPKSSNRRNCKLRVEILLGAHRHRVSRTEQRGLWCDPKHSFEMRITLETHTRDKINTAE